MKMNENKQKIEKKAINEYNQNNKHIFSTFR